MSETKPFFTALCEIIDKIQNTHELRILLEGIRELEKYMSKMVEEKESEDLDLD